jgi:hypothetical protein
MAKAGIDYKRNWKGQVDVSKNQNVAAWKAAQAVFPD